MSKIKHNEKQLEAINYLEGPLLILAGAGSGKTRTVTSRIANIIENGKAKPYEVLAITFTNKAAREMRERIEESIDTDTSDMWVMTFHSMCCRILRQNIEKMNQGYTKWFSIYDDTDSLGILKNVASSLNLNTNYYSPQTLRSQISTAKNGLMNPDEYRKYLGDDFRADSIAKAYQMYEEELRKNNSLDFDDLLIKVLELFVTCPEVLSKYQNRFKYIHVDEYQDTNAAQYEIVKALSAARRNICVVGDDDQSIYGWRGADIRNILDFEKDFKDAKVIKLEQNYRSTSKILDAANAVISNNTGRKDKQMWTDRGEGIDTSFYKATTEREEADYIYNEIKKLTMLGEYKLSDFCVLYRTNVLSRILEDRFMRGGMSYAMYGGQKFYDRKEIKDLTAYLRTIVNPADEGALLRVINVPKRGIGATTVERLRKIAEAHNITLREAMHKEDKVSEVMGTAAKTKILGFSNMMDKLEDKKDSMSLVDFIEEVMKTSGMVDFYKSQKTEEAETRLNNMGELLSAAKEFAIANEESSLESFLENIALVSDIDSMKENRDYVTMLTAHSAKGLEFPIVFTMGMEEGLFPHQRAMGSDDDIEEERRLCYVAMTRAKDKLYLTCSTGRLMFGTRRYNPLSRFIDEIPEELLNNCTPKPKVVDKSTFRQAATFSFTEFSKDKINVKKKKEPKMKIRKEYNMGDKVEHKKFGVGTIVSVAKSASGEVITIAFEGNGVKELDARFAKLKKL
jgi:DNA helicase-2/ATP-dependent DNA helicase PcrA